MKQVLTVETQNYDITISDDSIKKLMGDLKIYTSGQKKLFVVSKKVWNLYG